MNFETKFLWLLIFPVLLASCNEDKDKLENNSEESQFITLIYNSNFKDTVRILANKINPAGKYNPIVVYSSIERPYKSEVLIEDSKQFVDTLSIEISSEKVILKHTYNMDDYYFLISKGDTLIYDSPNGVPSYVLSHDPNNLEYQFEKLKKSRNQILPKSDNFDFFTISEIVIKGYDSENQMRKYAQYFEKKIESEDILLDSLAGKNLISEESYEMYKIRNYFDYVNLSYKRQVRPYLDQSKIRAIKLGSLLKIDSLLPYKFYKDFLVNYTFNNLGISKYVDDHGTYNSKMFYDSIAQSSTFSEKTKNYLLAFFFENIINDFSIVDSNDYLARAEIDITDSLILAKFKENYLFDMTEIKEIVGGVQNIKLNKEIISLEEIITQNKGKLLYIDFWASWCAPCRAVMPDSRKLRKEYNNEEITFVYLSIDKDYQKWKKAVENEDLTYYKHNYLTVNYPASKFFEQLKLSSIPRYLLYNKEGELIHKNAPGPDTKEIKLLFSEYLTK